ncbi:MAG: Fic family protein [Candidatus Levybacteria bacterium]|nr:Fic family protein [Candidatus Levybacteria bacterium]MBI3069787.1 Fic family protein [Candidatus Levybacteria bacterium]
MYQPRFTITNKILKNIGIIEACKEVIDHAPLLPYYEKKFRDEALIRTVHYGTHIEGNELNLSQAERVLAGEDVVGRDRDIWEVINYRKVTDYISGIQNSNYEITEEVIKKIHKITVHRILPEKESGEYRKKQVVLKNSKTGQVSFKPPLAIAVPYQIKDLLSFINSDSNKDIHPVLKSGVVHYELVRIHPFLDGNGRVARALSTLILFLEGYDIRKFFSLEEYFDKDAGSYYKALQSVQKQKGDLTFWLEYFTQGLSFELSKIKERVERISIDAKLKEKLGGKPILLSDRQLKIIEYIQQTGYLQNKAFKTLFPFVSEDTILNELKPLLKEGIIKKKGITKSAKYVMG